MGEVFAAHDEELDRLVALKRLSPASGFGADRRQRFEREARITRQLDHPGIVPIHGLGHDPNGNPVYAMRFVEGETLADAIASFHRATIGHGNSVRHRFQSINFCGGFSRCARQWLMPLIDP